MRNYKGRVISAACMALILKWYRAYWQSSSLNTRYAC